MEQKNTRFKARRAIFLVGVMFLLISFLPLVSANLDKISYLKGKNGNPDLRVEFFDTFLGIDFLWKTKNWGTAELKSHPSVNYVKKVGAGKQVVMWYDFNFVELYKNGLGEPEFVDVRTGKKVERDWRYVYWGNETYEVPVYSCQIKTSVNGTEYEDCVQTGTETKTREAWLPYNSRDIPKGKIRIGIEVEVKVNDYIDGKWIVGGKKIDRHASWEEAVVDAHGIDLDLGDSQTRRTGVLIYTKTGEYEKLLLTDVNLGGDSEATNCSLYTLGNTHLTSASVSGFVASFSYELSNATYYRLECHNNGASYFEDRAVASYPIVGTNIDYISGSRDGVNNDTAAVYNIVSITTARGPIPMKIILFSPGNNTNFTTSTINFSANVSDPTSLGIENVTIEVWNTDTDTLAFSETNSSGTEGVYNWTANLDDGNYNWTVYAVDGTNFDTWESDTRVFKIDTAPVISVTSPTSNTNYSTSNIWFNATSSLSVDYWIINYNGTNITIDDQSGTTLNELLSVEDGTYNLTIYANNSETGVWGVNDSVKNFMVDVTPPSVSVTYPNETIDFHGLNTNLSLNWTVSDDHLDSCWFEWNGINTSVNCNDNHTTFNITTGEVKSLTFYANDTFGNINSDTVTWDYKIFFNEFTYNSTAYETADESYLLNITEGGLLSSVKMNYNGTNYTMTPSSGLYVYSKTIPSEWIGDNNITFYYTYSEELIEHPHNYTQTVSSISLTVKANSSSCPAGYPYYNITFKNENNLSAISASNGLTSLTYYLGSGSVNKTLTSSNSTENPNYLLCFSPQTRTLHVEDFIFKYEANNYPLRTYSINELTLTNSTTNLTLYLLSINDGLYVSFFFVDQGGSPIEGVSATISREISGETIKVGEDTTGSDGVVTFWLNPDYPHVLTGSKTGYETVTYTLTPTQNIYTVTMNSLGGEEAEYAHEIPGVEWIIRPPSGIINSSIRNFNATVTSLNESLINCRFEILNSSNSVVASGEDITNSSYCFINIEYTPSSDDVLFGRLKIHTDYSDGYVIVDLDSKWSVLDKELKPWRTITSFFSDLRSIGEFGEGLKGEFNRIILFFLITTIFLGVFFYITNIEVLNRGITIILIFFITLIASFGDFFHIELGSNDIFLEQYAFAVAWGLMTVAYFISKLGSETG